MSGAGASPAVVRTALAGRAEGRRRWGSLRAGTLAAVVVLWEVVSCAHVVPPVFLPSPLAVAGELVRMASTGDLWRHVAPSLSRIAAGFAVGSAVGLVVGVAAGVSPVVEAVVDPLVAALYPVPKIALLPLLILWLGIGEASKVAVIGIGAFFPVAIGSMAAVREVDPLLVRAAQSLGATPFQVVTKVRLPASLPAIFASLRLAAGMALLLVVSAEMIAASAGIGYLILYAGDLMQTARLLSGIVVLSLVGLLTTSALQAVERRLLRGRQRL